MKNNIIYHRSDLDGYCSAAIAKMAYGHANMIGYEYGDDNPLEGIEVDDRVIMVDISLPIDNMTWLYEYTDLIWIDHHKSAMASSLDYEYGYANGKRKVGDSASLLAWKYYFPNEDVPPIVYWVDRYDVWKQGEDWDDVMAVQYGMRMHMGDPKGEIECNLWFQYLEGRTMSSIVNDGRLLLQFERKQNKIRCGRAFDLDWEGLKFACVNAFPGGSVVLDSYAQSWHDALMVFGYNGSNWQFSMYKNEKSDKKIDLSLIAVKHGGGGHAAACGFAKSDINQVIK